MICPKCGSEHVTVSTNRYTRSQSRSLLWNLFMLFMTAGIWLVWMLIRKRKEKTVKETVATCQNCGYSWKPASKQLASGYSRANVSSPLEIENGSISNTTSNGGARALDELDKLKRLYDQGVVDEETFNTKKDELLARYKEESSPRVKYNFLLTRQNERPFGNAKTKLYVDGSPLDNNTDNPVYLNLTEGYHEIMLYRAAIHSKPINVEISNKMTTKLCFKENGWSLDLYEIE